MRQIYSKTIAGRPTPKFHLSVKENVMLGIWCILQNNVSI